jgi:hypothetical protein
MSHCGRANRAQPGCPSPGLAFDSLPILALSVALVECVLLHYQLEPYREHHSRNLPSLPEPMVLTEILCGEPEIVEDPHSAQSSTWTLAGGGKGTGPILARQDVGRNSQSTNIGPIPVGHLSGG